MSLHFELKAEQSQKLVMTPELQQAIGLLQLSSLELNSYVQEEMINNPLLELNTKVDCPEETSQNEKVDSKGEPLVDENERTAPDSHFELEEYLSDEEPYQHSWSYQKSGSDFSAVEYFISSETSLQEHLLFQLHTSVINSTTGLLGEYIIGSLDENGYFRGEIADHARSLGVEEDELIKVLKLVQSFEPPGIAARNLQECLLLQISERSNVPTAVETVIKEHLTDVAEGGYRFIAQKMGICHSEIQVVVDYICSLNPKPGACYGSGQEVKYIVPDIIVEKIEEDYIITVNDNIPHLVINPFYRNMLRGNGDEEIRGYIKKRLGSALWLIRSIEQRRTTLYNVTRQIINIQRPFLEKGIHFLKPLTLREVAEEVGMHESTISRVTANKYMQTPRGLFSLKFFFCGGLSGQKGNDKHSVLSIKTHLKELIEKEDSSAPYSDRELEDIFKSLGIDVSRRTITKYRKELNIQASYKRRRH